MTRRPDLGLVLAGFGLLAIAGAVVAGFIAVGGPGQARSIRLDLAKLDRIRDIGRAAACAAKISGDIPASLADLAALPSRVQPSPSPTDGCQYYDIAALTDPKDIHYERIDQAHVRLCAQFFLPYARVRDQGNRFGREAGFPELDADRPAGNHCYDIKVVG